jgi:hypothetical protein
MTVEVKDVGWLVGFLGRHVSRSIRGREWARAVAHKYRLHVTVTHVHTIEMHDYAGALFRVVLTHDRGATVAWACPNYSRLYTANEKRLTSDVRRMLRRHGLLTRAPHWRTA